MNAITDILNTKYFRKATNKTKHYLHDILFLFSITNKMNLMDYQNFQGNSRLENVSCREHFGSSAVDRSLSLSFRTDSYTRPRSEQGFQFRLFAANNEGRQRICILDDHLIKRLLPFEFLVTPTEPLKSCISSKYIRTLYLTKCV